MGVDPKKLRRSRCFIAGAILFLLGTGPLLTIMAIAKMGLTKDPDPNPVAFGMLAGITFWPSIIMLAIGVFRSTR